MWSICTGMAPDFTVNLTAGTRTCCIKHPNEMIFTILQSLVQERLQQLQIMQSAHACVDTLHRKQSVSVNMCVFAGGERTGWRNWGESEFSSARWAINWNEFNSRHLLLSVGFCAVIWIMLSLRGTQGSQAYKEHRVWEWVTDGYLVLAKDISVPFCCMVSRLQIHSESPEWVFAFVIRAYRDPVDRQEKRWDWFN